MTKREFHILNLGAGVQSTFLYLLMYLSAVLNGDIEACEWALAIIARLSDGDLAFIKTFPRIDAAIFADTGDEEESTLANLQWLKSLNGPPILVRSKGNLMEDLLREDTGDGRKATIPAFTENGGKVKRQCTKEYKTEVIERTLRREILGLQPRQRVPTGTRVHQYIGISLDESARAGRIIDQMKREVDEDDLEFAPDEDFAWSEPHFPLVDLLMTRSNCEEKLAEWVPHKVGQSACKKCPFRDDPNWAAMKIYRPEAFAEAVAFDEAIREPGRMIQRGLSEPLYLHRSCKPLGLVQLDTRPDPRKAQIAINFSSECLGVCGM